jgi:uncharacterized membrane protein HdeD (DUF308 family)
MLAAALLVGGMIRIEVSLAERFQAWGWVVVNGILSVLLGTLIAIQWPVSGLWVIGAVVGIELIANGISWSVVAIRVRSALAPFGNR